MQRTNTGKVRAVTEELSLSYLLLELANQCVEIKTLLQRFVETIKQFMDCEAVGIRLLDEDGNIPYEAYIGFSDTFYHLESPLSTKSDKCMCINVITGDIDKSQPFFTDNGSFFMNSTSNFLENATPEMNVQTRNICNLMGYESIALIPIKQGGKIIGLIHIADQKENIVPLEKTLILENSARQLGNAISRIRALEAMNESEKKFRFLIDSISDVIWRINASTMKITYCSPSIREMLGYSQAEISGFSIDNIMSSSSFESAQILLQQSLVATAEYSPGEISSPEKIELEMLHQNGDTVYTESSIRIYHDPNDGFVILGISRDIHLRKIMEEEKILLERQLMQAHKMEAIGVLAAGIAHDFNNIIQGFTSLAQVASLELRVGYFNADKLLSYLDDIISLGSRGAMITGQMLGLARQGKNDPQIIDPNAIINEVCMVLRKGFASTTRYAIHCCTNSKRHILADPTQLHQVLNNLAVNARDAMPNGGTITIMSEDVTLTESKLGKCELIHPGKYILISISDNGTGIDDDLIGKIFDPFFTTKEKDKGTGLGLAQVWGIVHNHGASIDVLTSNKGTVFRLYFPVTESNETILNSEKRFHFGNLHGLKILVVDDEEVVRSSVARWLERHGLIVTIASNGIKALNLFEKCQYDIVLTDIIMEPMRGDELFRRIRNIDPNAKVLIMSGYEEDAIISQLIAEGAMGFVSKPFDLLKLLEKIRNCISD